MNHADRSSGSPPSVTVLCGFLGVGKTTLLRHLLGQAATYAGGQRWAAIVNDMAAINIDARLVEASAGAARMVEIGNGCVCCTVRSELAETVAELCATGKYDHVLIETTGVAEPRAIAQLFIQPNAFGRRLGDFARLHALVTVVDPRSFLDEWQRQRPGALPAGGASKPVFELLLDQAECADVLVLNKCDLVSEAEKGQVEEILHGLNPRAELLHAEQGQVPCELLLDRPRFDPIATLGAARWIRTMQDEARPAGSLARRRVPPPHVDRLGIGSFVFQARRPFVREKFLVLFTTGLPIALLRAKGFFWLAEQPDDLGFVSVAGGVARIEFIGTWAAAMRERGIITTAEIPAAARAKWEEPAGDRRQEIVLIGLGLDWAGWDEKLTGCLVKKGN